MILKTINEKQALYAEQKLDLDQKIRSEDGRYYNIMETSSAVRFEHSKKKVKHRKLTEQLKREREAEAKLDADLEKILGRACTMEDLEALYQQDLKLLN